MGIEAADGVCAGAEQPLLYKTTLGDWGSQTGAAGGRAEASIYFVMSLQIIRCGDREEGPFSCGEAGL